MQTGHLTLSKAWLYTNTKHFLRLFTIKKKST